MTFISVTKNIPYTTPMLNAPELIQSIHLELLQNHGLVFNNKNGFFIKRMCYRYNANFIFLLIIDHHQLSKLSFLPMLASMIPFLTLFSTRIKDGNGPMYILRYDVANAQVHDKYYLQGGFGANSFPKIAGNFDKNAPIPKNTPAIVNAAAKSSSCVMLVFMTCCCLIAMQILQF